MAAFLVDAVLIVVGDQAVAIEHFIETENSRLFQGQMQSRSIQLPECWFLDVTLLDFRPIDTEIFATTLN